MVKVITYGTFDVLHYGHIRLLERAKSLGDYLIVGITSDDYDKTRGKINSQQTLNERIEAVKKTGIADKIIIEEYEGQKIDDIRRYHIDIFTVGSDWVGHFDYLNEYCHVEYLPRTEGISSSDIRNKRRAISMGIVGTSRYINKIVSEGKLVNGINLSGLCADKLEELNDETKSLPLITDDYQQLLDVSNAVYINSMPHLHYEQIKVALEQEKHVLCESPIALKASECRELYELAKKKDCLLVDAIRTAYSTAFNRLVLLVKCGKVGKVISVDAVCTSLRDVDRINSGDISHLRNSMTAWGPTALLPIIKVLGINYSQFNFASHFVDDKNKFDSFTKTTFVYPSAVASLKVGTGAKSEGELIISGTKGYIHVPAPWWKTDYFELRYENMSDNRRFFYQLEGEGIRYELAEFVKCIENKIPNMYIQKEESETICEIMEAFTNHENMVII